MKVWTGWIFASLGVACIPLATILGRWQLINDGLLSFLSFLMILFFVVALLWAFFVVPPLRCKKMDGRVAWYTGVGREFLDSLNQF